MSAGAVRADETTEFQRWAAGIGGGVAVPTGAYADVLQVGPVFDLVGEHWLSPKMSLVLTAGVVSNPPKDEFAPPDQDASARLYRVFLSGRYTAPGAGLRPFGNLGIGGVNRKVMLDDVYGEGTEVIDESRTRFGGTAGVGLVIPAGEGWDLLPEISYLWVPLSDDELLGASSQNSVLATVALRLRF